MRRVSQPFFAAALRLAWLWLWPPIRPPLRLEAWLSLWPRPEPVADPAADPEADPAADPARVDPLVGLLTLLTWFGVPFVLLLTGHNQDGRLMAPGVAAFSIAEAARRA